MPTSRIFEEVRSRIERENGVVKLFDSIGLPNPDRVRIALAEKGALDQVEIILVNLWEAEHRTAAFKVKNPSITMPLLDLDNGVEISETTAIAKNIDHTFVGIARPGSSPQERAVVHTMQRRDAQKIVDEIGVYFHRATLEIAPEIEVDHNKVWGEARYQKTPDGMAYFDAVLRDPPCRPGRTYSMADITVFTELASSETYLKVMVPHGLSALTKWRQRIATRAANAFVAETLKGRP